MFDIDYAALLKIIGIDIMLGVDNAIVIALACQTLPAHLQKKAIAYGTAGAIGLRAILLFLASYIVQIPYVKLVAGAYLIYIGYKLLVQVDEEHNIKGATSMRGAIQTIIVADFMMSLDNVLGVTGAAQSTGEHSIWYALFGILLTIPIIVLGASYIMRAMERFPILLWIGAGLLGWVGAEMILTEPALATYVHHLEQYMGKYTHQIIEALGFGAVVGAAYVKEKYVDHIQPTINS